jgi:hypothetical protein
LSAPDADDRDTVQDCFAVTDTTHLNRKEGGRRHLICGEKPWLESRHKLEFLILRRLTEETFLFNLTLAVELPATEKTSSPVLYDPMLRTRYRSIGTFRFPGSCLLFKQIKCQGCKKGIVFRQFQDLQ